MPTMSLPCTMTDEDRKAVALKLAGRAQRMLRVEAKKSEACARWNAKIKTLKNRIKGLAQQLEDGVVRREVEVREERDGLTGTIKVVRLDDGTVVTTAMMDPDERQLSIGGASPTVSGKAGEEQAAATDEQREAATPEEAEAMRAERIAAEERERAAAAAREARVEAKLAELWPKHVVALHTDPTRPDFANYVARLETPAWVMEADGESAAVAVIKLENKLREKLREDEAEVERLAAEQARDQAAEKPRRGGLDWWPSEDHRPKARQA